MLHKSIKNRKKTSMKKSILITFIALFLANFAHAIDATPAQIEALKPKFSVQDCKLWKGGEGHENDNVPKIYSEHVEAIFEFLDNLSINEAMRAIELYCSSKGFDGKAAAQ
jgi:hypothetical protein